MIEYWRVCVDLGYVDIGFIVGFEMIVKMLVMNGLVNWKNFWCGDWVCDFIENIFKVVYMLGVYFLRVIWMYFN